MALLDDKWGGQREDSLPCPSSLSSFPSVWGSVVVKERVSTVECVANVVQSAFMKAGKGSTRVVHTDRWQMTFLLGSPSLMSFRIICSAREWPKNNGLARSCKWFVSLCHRHFVRHHTTKVQFHAALGNLCVGSFISSSYRQANLNRPRFECHSW